MRDRLTVVDVARLPPLRLLTVDELEKPKEPLITCCVALTRACGLVFGAFAADAVLPPTYAKMRR